MLECVCVSPWQCPGAQTQCVFDCWVFVKIWSGLLCCHTLLALRLNHRNCSEWRQTYSPPPPSPPLDSVLNWEVSTEESSSPVKPPWLLFVLTDGGTRPTSQDLLIDRLLVGLVCCLGGVRLDPDVVSDSSTLGETSWPANNLPPFHLSSIRNAESPARTTASPIWSIPQQIQETLRDWRVIWAEPLACRIRYETCFVSSLEEVKTEEETWPASVSI